jgi:hypothetical protein
LTRLIGVCSLQALGRGLRRSDFFLKMFTSPMQGDGKSTFTDLSDVRNTMLVRTFFVVAKLLFVLGAAAALPASLGDRARFHL